MSETISYYTIELRSTHGNSRTAPTAAAVARLRSLIKEMEENLTDLLPEGFSIHISEVQE